MNKRIKIIVVTLITIAVLIAIGLIASVVVQYDNSEQIEGENLSTNIEDNNNASRVTYSLLSDIDNTEPYEDGKTQLEIVLDELEDKKKVTMDGSLELIIPEYKLYTVYGNYTDNFYSVNINKNHFLFPYKIECGNATGFVIVDNELNLQPVKLEYSFSSLSDSKFEDKKVIEKDGWKFAYNSEKGELYGYYELNKGYLQISLTNKEVSYDDYTLNDLTGKLADAFVVAKEDVQNLAEVMVDGQYTPSFAKLSDEDSIIEINDEYQLDFSDVYLLHWYVSSDWDRNDLQVITEDFKEDITIRESLGEYNLEEIQSSSDTMELVPYDYNGTPLQLIYGKFEEGSLLEEYDGAFLGFIMEINNKSYAFMFELKTEEGFEQLYRDDDPKGKIDMVFNTILKKNN